MATKSNLLVLLGVPIRLLLSPSSALLILSGVFGMSEGVGVRPGPTTSWKNNIIIIIKKIILANDYLIILHTEIIRFVIYHKIFQNVHWTCKMTPHSFNRLQRQILEKHKIKNHNML